MVIYPFSLPTVPNGDSGSSCAVHMCSVLITANIRFGDIHVLSALEDTRLGSELLRLGVRRRALLTKATMRSMLLPFLGIPIPIILIGLFVH